MSLCTEHFSDPDAMHAAASVGMLLTESTWISSHLLQELEEGELAQAAVPFVQTLLRSSGSHPNKRSLNTLSTADTVAALGYEGWKLLEPVMDAIANGTILFQRADGSEGPGALIVTAMLEAGTRPFVVYECRKLMTLKLRIAFR